MALKVLISVFLGVAFFASTTLVHANLSESTTIGISVVVPEHAEDQKCVIGFENNNQFTALQNTGCHYNTHKLMQTAYQKATVLNTQGFVTVIITVP